MQRTRGRIRVEWQPVRLAKTKTTADNEDTGYANHRVELKKEQLLANINAIQDTCSITRSKALSSGVAPINLDIEMETGTGKTYVYIKTILELNKELSSALNTFIAIETNNENIRNAIKKVH